MIEWQDLRGWLQEAEKIGELARIKEEVDWDEELSAITYLTGKKLGGPALFFEKVKGYDKDKRVLSNILGSSLNRIALALGLPLNTRALDMIRMTKDIYKRRIPPREISDKDAPINENTLTGEDIDVTMFPAPKMWHHDGGRYIGTGDSIITRDPESGYINLGTYRQMIMNKRQVGFYVSPGKDALLHRERCWSKGQPCQVAAVYGTDPLLFICSAMGFPKNISEYDAIGGIMGRPYEVVKGKTVDLLIPAHAEIVIEGIAYPDDLQSEGPFGEFQGYYGRPGGPTPVIDVTCVRFRNQPILTAALMADHPSCEQNLFFGIARSAKIWDDLETVGVPAIRGVYSVPAAAGGFGMVVVSIEQRYPGHAAQVAALAAQCSGSAYYTKWIVVVDDDVDPTDIEQVIWAMSTRCDPASDIDILRNTWSTYLDPTKNPAEERPYGSKTLINACKEHRFLKTFSKRTRLTKPTYEKVQQRWKSYGLPFDIPAIDAFEPDL
ncbi:MAG TPA: UbiD family decarboxylase [Syntrophorhabdales bacterium]|nr:UbiD family decarboxylase [Syntrophorhabdales bacterium]